MAKIVKYCNSCDEGFAEKFAFCPTCGTTLEAFAMNPVEPSSVAAEEVTAEREILAPTEPPVTEDVSGAATVVAAGATTAVVADKMAGHIDEDEADVSEPEEEDEVPVTVAVPAAAAASVFAAKAVHANEPRAMKVTPDALDDGYYITVIEEKNVKQRNMLLLGSAVFCVGFAIFWTGWSLWAKDFDIAAIDGDKMFSAVIVEEPMTVEEEKVQKEKDKGGGGGGGGREDEEEVSQGDLADQSRHPTRPPDAKVPRMDNFELVTPPPQTEGDRKFPKNFDRWGNPLAKFGGLSNGPGSGGGMGTGFGTGQGSGRGTGTGSGSGSGSGGGSGDGNGDGAGSGGSGGSGPPPVRPPITKDLRIISKARPGYTDAARQNQITGTVTLRVTFLASGQIGGITTISGLPHGLTEQAISAARRITFEPKMVNGVAQSVSRPVTFTFTIY